MSLEEGWEDRRVVRCCHTGRDQSWGLNATGGTPQPCSAPALPVDAVDALQVGHGFANLQRVQDESEHLQGALVPLQVVAELQEGERAIRATNRLSVELGGQAVPWGANPGWQGGPAMSFTNGAWDVSAEWGRQETGR